MVKLPFELWIVAFLLFFAIQEAKTQDGVPGEKEIVLADSIDIITFENDSINSLNILNDSTIVKSDSIKKKNTLDAPVNMTAKDSMVMVMEGGNFLYLYGAGTVKHKELNLDAENIEMDADKSQIYAYFGIDSLGTRFGFPVFKSGEQESEMEELWYNFNSTKMYSKNAITKQGESFIKAGVAKKMPDGSFFMENAILTTCDDLECPHFHFHLTKAKHTPGKNTVTGPVYLVLEGVPMPFALPFGFFPASKEYSSGILMPTYKDEMARGFALVDGGYYFAFNDYIDMAVRGEFWTKGSWGINIDSKYKKMYKYSGNLIASYLVTVLGDKDTKNMPNSDYSVSRDIKIGWNHMKDPRSNPSSTFSANVQFSTSSYNRNDYGNSTYEQMSQNTKASSVSYGYRSPTHPNFSINASFSLNQRSRDSTLTVSLPDMTISLTNIYPFKRKEQIGSERWYEKIYLSYTGVIRNSISDVKEYQFFKKNLIRDWRNGIKHSIPVSASFNLMKYITVSTSFNYNENWYTNHANYEYDYEQKRVMPVDTVYGFFRTYDYNASISMSTKLYGMYKPWSIFAKPGTVIRHVFTPSISFSGAPDFSDPKLGMYKDVYYAGKTFEQQYERKSLYEYHLFGGPSRGRTGAINISIDNNLEMKVPIAGTDSTRKISLIDNFGLRTSYNFLKDSLNWSNLSATLRLKIFKTNLTLSGMFDVYTYGENGQPINVPRWKAGKGIGRFTGTSTSKDFSIDNEKLKKLFKKDAKDSSSNSDSNKEGAGAGEEDDTTEETNNLPRTSMLSSKKTEGDYDSDGYLIFTIPWSLGINYSINLGYDRQNFNKEKREYPYKISQSLGFNGRIQPTKAWEVSFNGSYDFDTRSIVSMQCRISRKMHCWTMSASIVPIGPYQNYQFSIQINSQMLQDIKYQQSSTERDALHWGH